MATKETDRTGELKINMENTKKAWVQSKKELDELSNKIAMHEAKKEQIEKEMQKAEDILSNAEDERAKALEALVAEEITEAQLNEIKRKHEQARQRKEDYAEMLETVADKILKLAHEYADLTRDVMERERFFWASVTEVLIEETLKNPVAIRACLSYRGILRPGDFFEDKILKRLTEGETKKMRDDLVEQYAK